MCPLFVFHLIQVIVRNFWYELCSLAVTLTRVGRVQLYSIYLVKPRLKNPLNQVLSVKFVYLIVY